MSIVDVTAASKRLDDIIAMFGTHAVSQDANLRSAKGETEKQKQLRLKLRSQQMEPIADIARRNLRSVPEFAALQMPPTSAKGGAFVASAQAMLNAASIHKDTLLERGLAPDFLDLFQASLAKFAASVSDRGHNLAQRIGDTKGLALQEQEGRAVLRLLDSLLSRALSGNDALLAQWQGARAIRRGSVASTSTTSTSTSTPTSSSTSTATPQPAPAATPAVTPAATPSITPAPTPAATAAPTPTATATSPASPSTTAPA
jgi:hypothetical protein